MTTTLKRLLAMALATAAFGAATVTGITAA